MFDKGIIELENSIPTKITYEGLRGPIGTKNNIWEGLVYSDGFLHVLQEIVRTEFNKPKSILLKFTDDYEWLVKLDVEDADAIKRLQKLKEKTTFVRVLFNFDIELI